MGLLAWILVGLVAGLIAQFVLGGGIGGGGVRGVLVTILLGVGGALLGGLVASAAGWGDVTGFNLTSIIIATIGAIVVVIVWQAVTRSRGGRFA